VIGGVEAGGAGPDENQPDSLARTAIDVRVLGRDDFLCRAGKTVKLVASWDNPTRRNDSLIWLDDQTRKVMRAAATHSRSGEDTLVYQAPDGSEHRIPSTDEIASDFAAIREAAAQARAATGGRPDRNRRTRARHGQVERSGRSGQLRPSAVDRWKPLGQQVAKAPSTSIAR